MRIAVRAACAWSTIEPTSLRTAATICSSIVLASCRLMASDVRHHITLDAAAVSKMAISTSAETTSRTLTVNVPPAVAEAGRRSKRRSSFCRIQSWKILITAHPIRSCALAHSMRSILRSTANRHSFRPRLVRLFEKPASSPIRSPFGGGGNRYVLGKGLQTVQQRFGLKALSVVNVDICNRYIPVTCYHISGRNW